MHNAHPALILVGVGLTQVVIYGLLVPHAEAEYLASWTSGLRNWASCVPRAPEQKYVTFVE